MSHGFVHRPPGRLPRSVSDSRNLPEAGGSRVEGQSVGQGANEAGCLPTGRGDSGPCPVGETPSGGIVRGLASSVPAGSRLRRCIVGAGLPIKTKQADPGSGALLPHRIEHSAIELHSLPNARPPSAPGRLDAGIRHRIGCSPATCRPLQPTAMGQLQSTNIILASCWCSMMDSGGNIPTELSEKGRTEP